MNKKERLLDLRKDIEKLNSSIEVLKTQLNDLDSIIQVDGFIPSTLNSATVSSLQEIDFLNNLCIEKLKAIDSGISFPETLSDLSKVVSNCIEADNEIQLFENLRTDIGKLKNSNATASMALSSIQQELEKLDVNSLSSEEVQSVFSKYQKLYYAVLEQDASKRLSVMMELKDSFDAQVLISLLATGDVFTIDTVPDKSGTPNKNIDTPTATVEQLVESETTDRSHETATTPQKEKNIENTLEYPTEGSNERTSVSDKSETTTEDEDEIDPDEFETCFFDSLKECGGIVPQSEDYKVSETPKANKEFQRKKFQNDISEIGELSKDVFAKCVTTGAITPNMFSSDLSVVLEVTSVITKLYDKGYLRLFNIPELGSFYAPSNRAWKAYENQGVRSFIGIKSNTGISKVNYSTYDRNGLIISLLISRSYEIMTKNYDSFLSHVVKFNNSFVAAFKGSEPDTEKSLIFTGIVTDNKEGLLAYSGDFIEMIDEKEADIVVCGINHTQAEAVADALEKVFSDVFENREVFLYDYTSDTTFSYGTGEESRPSLLSGRNIIGDVTEDESLERKDTEEGEEILEAGGLDSDEKEQELLNNENSVEEQHINTSTKVVCEIDSVEKDNIKAVNEEKSEIKKSKDLTGYDNGAFVLRDCISPAEYAIKLLDLCKNNRRDATDEEIEELVLFLLRDGKRVSQGATVVNSLTQAFYLAKSVSKDTYPRTYRLYRQLRTAIAYPGEEEQYSGTALNDLFNGETDREAITIAAYMVGLFASETAHDYTLITQARDILEHNPEYFEGLEDVKAIIHLLCELRASIDVKRGFTKAMVLSLADTKGHKVQVQELRDTAKDLLEEPTIKVMMHGIPDLRHSLFGADGLFRKGIDIVVHNATDRINEVKDIINKYAINGDDGFILKSDSVDKLVDREWNKATKKKSTEGMPLKLMARQRIMEEIQKRLDVMNQWITIVENQKDSIPEAIHAARETLLKRIPEARKALNTNIGNGQAVVLDRALEFMEDRLNGEDQVKIPYLTADMLRTGYIALDKQFVPIMDETYNQVRYYELWRSMLHHIATPVEDLLVVRSKIRTDESSELFDNFEQCALIDRYLEMKEIPVEKVDVDEYDIMEAKKKAEKIVSKFKAKLELAYAYSQLFESDKEDIEYLIEEHQDTFYEQMNFGSVLRFVHALDDYQSELADARRNELEANLNHLYEQAKAEGEARVELLDEASRLLSDPSQRYGLAEEYLNRFEVGERELNSNLKTEEQNGSFQDFISDDVFLELLKLCENEKGMAMSSSKSSIASYVRKKIPSTWGANEKKRSEELLNCWPSKAGMTKPDRMASLFELLSFDVSRAVREMQDRRMELWRLYCKPAEKNVSDYRHPIALFGTRMPEYINVLCIFGIETARNLVDRVCSKNLGGITIVLLDAACRRSMRREIAEYFHTTKTGRNPFLLVDRVLFLYLVLHEPASRLPLLLKCTLPYTIYQPFTNGKGSTPDEMFFGRTLELNTIISPDGANFVYGGRQLGKTALLERAENLVNRPEKKEYAIYVSVYEMASVETVTAELIHGINKKTNLKIGMHKDLNGLCDEFSERFRNNEIFKALLLIDEADRFLASIKDDSYKAIQPLVNLMRETGNSFKFVLAGLHNVFRARKAIAENGIFGQLGMPLCVKPLSSNEAYGLITQPLRYLGFSTDNTSYLETILTNTNYFPGILQYFGYTLVANVHTEYIKYYGKDKNPPFDLQEQMLGDIMNSTDLNDNIRRRLCATLDLDARYFAIARCIAMLYFMGTVDELRRGYTIKEMKETAKDFDIMRLDGMNENEFATLLEELQNMGIVIKNERENRYRFRRRAFINIICKDSIDQLEKDINADNEEFLA